MDSARTHSDMTANCLYQSSEMSLQASIAYLALKEIELSLRKSFIIVSTCETRDPSYHKIRHVRAYERKTMNGLTRVTLVNYINLTFLMTDFDICVLVIDAITLSLRCNFARMECSVNSNPRPFFHFNLRVFVPPKSRAPNLT